MVSGNVSLEPAPQEQATYYGYFVMLGVGVVAGIVFWIACALHWRLVLGPTLPAVAFATGVVWTAEGLALALDWRGAARRLGVLRERGHPSLVVRFLTWVPAWPRISVTAAFRITGVLSLAYGVFLFGLTVVFLAAR